MSMVHASRGMLKPAAPDLLSEPAIVAGIAKATKPDVRICWDWMLADYDRIRDAIEAVFPAFRDFNNRFRTTGAFLLPVGFFHRETGIASITEVLVPDVCLSVVPVYF